MSDTTDISRWLDEVEKRANEIDSSGSMGQFDWSDTSGVADALCEANGNIALLCAHLRAAVKVVEAARDCKTVLRMADRSNAWQKERQRAVRDAENAIAAFRAACQSEGGKDAI